MIWTTLSWISVNLIPRWVGAGRSPTPIHPSQEKYNRKELLKPSRPDLLLIYSVSPTHLLLRRGVRSGVQLSCTETRFEKCSQCGKNGRKHEMLLVSMAYKVISCKKNPKKHSKHQNRWFYCVKTWSRNLCTPHLYRYSESWVCGSSDSPHPEKFTCWKFSVTEQFTKNPFFMYFHRHLQNLLRTRFWCHRPST